MRRAFVPLMFAPLVAVSPTAANAAPVTTLQPTTYTFPAGTWCPFSLEISVSGKAKTIDNPAGEIVIAPGQVASFTNTTEDRSVTYVITGVFHNTTLPNGDVVTQATGRNALYDPVAGLVLATGNFSYTMNAKGENVVPLHGTGTTLGICGQIS